MANEIVKYHNDMSSVAFPGFSQTDHNLYTALVFDSKNKGTEMHPIDYDHLKELAGFASKDDKRFVRYLDEFTDKLMSLQYRSYGDNGAFEKFQLFTGFRNDPVARQFWYRTSEELAYIINSDEKYLHGEILSLLSAGYTTYELRQHNALSSTYSKMAFRQLKRFKRTGWWYVKIEEFRRLLDVPVTYRLSDLRRRVLTPIREELSEFFDNLKIEEVKGRGENGRKTTVALKFTFKPQTEKGVWYDDETKAELSEEYDCPYCGDTLYMIIKKNGDVFYGHKDGWKASAPCKRTFGSLEEITNLKGNKKESENEKASVESKLKKAGFSCRECGRPLYILYNKKGELFYGHIDGAREDAVCRRTYGSIAEIRGYSETPTREDYVTLYEKGSEDASESEHNVYEILKNASDVLKGES